MVGRGYGKDKACSTGWDANGEYSWNPHASHSKKTSVCRKRCSAFLMMKAYRTCECGQHAHVLMQVLSFPPDANKLEDLALKQLLVRSTG